MKFLISNFSRRKVGIPTEASGQFSKYQRGQVMLLTVLVLGGSLIAASTIAGYLMLLKIRQSSDVTNSTKAIFAADSGIEWDLYRRFKNPDYPKPQLTNGADFNVFVAPTSTKSIGTASNISRAFEITF